MDNTWVYVDTKYLFKCWTWYLTSTHSKQVKFIIEHKKRYSISISNHILVCVDILITTFLMIFWRKKLSKVHLNISAQFLKISKDYQRILKITKGSLEDFNDSRTRLKQFVTFELFRLYVLWKSLPLVQLTIWLCLLPRVWMTCHLMYVKQLLMPSLSYTGLLLLVTHTCRAC